MGRKPVEKDRTENPKVKEEWIQKLAPIYLQDGMKRHTMDDIADKLGVSKATLYKYFTSRQEILEGIVRLKLEELRVFKQYLSDESVAYMDRYEKAVSSATVLLAGISNTFLLDVKEMHPTLWKTVKAFQDEALATARDFYKRGIELGIINDIDPTLIAIIDRMFIRAISNPKFLVDNKLDLQKAVEGFFSLKSFGIFKHK